MDNIVVYTDGACSNNGKETAKCSIGIHFSDNNTIKLATNYANALAGTAINLTSAPGSDETQKYNFTKHSDNPALAFRDYLIEHPNDRLQYEKLKMGLSEKEWFDGNEYNDSKNDFVKNLELKAILWYQNINQSND